MAVEQKRISRIRYNRSRTNIFETGVVIGNLAYAELYWLPRSIGFKLWTGKTHHAKARISKQIEIWYAPICADKEAEMNCLKFLQKGVKIAIQGERYTYEWHDIGTNQLHYRQINLAKKISVLGIEPEENVENKEDILLKIKSLDNLVQTLQDKQIKEYEDENT